VTIETWHRFSFSFASKAASPYSLPPLSHAAKGWSTEVGLLGYPAASSIFTLTVCGRQGNTPRCLRHATSRPRSGFPARPQAAALDDVAVTDLAWDEAAKTTTVKIPACGDKARILTLE